MPKNLGLYNENLSVPRKQDIDVVASRVSTNEDNIAMLDSDMAAAQGDITTLKGNVTTLTNALGSKQDKIVGGASTITDDNLTANRALVSNASGKVAASAVTATELGYLDGVTSNVQTQLNKKLESAPVTSVNAKTGAVVLGASDVGAVSTANVTQTLGSSTTKVPSEKAVADALSGAGTGDMLASVYDPNNKHQDIFAYVDNAIKDVKVTTDATPTQGSTNPVQSGGVYSALNNKVSKSGDTMTGKLTVPQVETGAGNSNFFQCRKFRGEGDANTYYHAIDFGYQNHDRVDFYEYGGIWNFFKNTSGKADGSSLCGKITTNGWEGGAKLTGSPTAPTPGTSDNSTRIATTAFVNSFNSTKLESNGDGSNVTAAFTAASTRANIATGEKLSVLFGKIAKWFADLGSLAFKSTVAKSDLASDVQTSLGKADSALQSAPVTSVNGKTGAVTINVPIVPSTTNILKGNGSGGLVAATRGSDYIASGNIVKQTLVASETTPTENYAINWVYG